MRPLKSLSRAFTIVEMLLVISLLSMISVAVFHAFVNGLKIWEKSYEARGEEDIFIFLDKLNRDLHNALAYSLVSFEGKESLISFPAIVRTPQDPRISHGENVYIEQIGKIRYYFDSANNRICREQANYSQALNNEFAYEEILARDVQSLRFRYEYYEGSSFVSRERARETMPSYLQVAVVYGDVKNPKKVDKNIPVFIGN